MIKLWDMKKEAATVKKKQPTQSTALIRVQKDLSELNDLPHTIKMTFPDPEDMLNFKVIITPDEGLYRGGRFHFTVHVEDDYPYSPPKVQCVQKIYHPNIDLEGKTCLNILRQAWKPVLNLHSVIIGLQLLFLDMNPDDPLNKEAAEDLRVNPDRFQRHVIESMRGGAVGRECYDNVMA